MNFIEQIEKIYLTEEEIPQEFALPEPLHQRTYLSDGEMVQWDGTVHEVYSPVCVRTPEGLKRKLIGTYPICTTTEAMAAVDAAVAAYKNGRGEWPTMRV